MNLQTELLAEFDQEMAGTRRLLERLPEDRLPWKPDPKSFCLAALANHLTALPVLGAYVLNGPATKPGQPTTIADILKTFDSHVALARQTLAEITEAELSQMIQVAPNVSKSRYAAFRSRFLNHTIHHRGQLTVYLRLLGVPIPGLYGPSADEKA